MKHDPKTVAEGVGRLVIHDLKRAERGGVVMAITRDWSPRLVIVPGEDIGGAELTDLGAAVLAEVRRAGRA